jgi:predicted metal-dependent hydrolase
MGGLTRLPLRAEDPPTLRLDDGRIVELRIRPKANARRIVLSVDVATGALNLSVPRRVSRVAAIDFARSKAGWILARLATLPPRIAFVDGAEVPFLGEALRLRHVPAHRGLAERRGNDICVGGDPAFMSRRTVDWLKREARREFWARARVMAERADRRVREIALRDSRSRWGSSGPDGRLMFCWRLIMAPQFVVDYVVAHEVAHLAHADHGPRFWALAKSLTGDVAEARRWLRREGARLFRFG